MEILSEMKTKKGEKELLRSIILDKALAYLKKHGNGNASTDQIMKFAGLTKGALYSHFTSKDDLFTQAVCRDLRKLEESIAMRFRDEGSLALRTMIEAHLSEKNIHDVGNSCVFTSLSTDMQRCRAQDRTRFESYVKRIYDMFATALKDQFPNDTPEQSLATAINLYSGLVGTLTMARTIKDPELARKTLEAGREFLIRSFVPKAR
jgi:TetR/AcrR family transcriptional regulator, transcriptional repressor for nem operon